MAFLRRLSIRSQLLILAVSTVLVILVIVYHTYSTMSAMVSRNHEEYVQQTVSEIKRNVTSNKDVLFRLMQTISYNADVQSYLIEQNPITRFEMFRKLNVMISSQRELKDGILDIVISGDNGFSVDINGGSPYGADLKNMLPGKVNAYYAGMHGNSERCTDLRRDLFSRQPYLMCSKANPLIKSWERCFSSWIRRRWSERRITTPSKRNRQIIYWTAPIKL